MGFILLASSQLAARFPHPLYNFSLYACWKKVLTLQWSIHLQTLFMKRMVSKLFVTLIGIVLIGVI